MVWAFATVTLGHDQLFMCTAWVGVARCNEMTPAVITNMLWAYGKLVAPVRANLFPSLFKVAMDRLDQFKLQEIPTLCWVAGQDSQFSECRAFLLVVPKFFDPMHLCEFRPQSLAVMVEALALDSVEDQRFFDAMVEVSLARLRSFEPPSLCTLFRGIALMGRRQLQSGVIAGCE